MGSGYGPKKALRKYRVQKCAIVTGSSRGIGKAIIRALLDAGYLAIGVQRTGNGVKADLGRLDALPEIWSRSLVRLGRPPDLVVLNAGIGVEGPFIDTSFEECISCINLDLLSPLLLAKEALKTWTESGAGGHLVFIGSQAALPGNKKPGHIVYTAAKGGIHSIIGPLAHEYGPSVRVNAVAPGNVLTLNELRLLRKTSGLRGASFRALTTDITRQAALKRWVRPSDIADAVLYLERSNALSGAVLNVSCGESVH